jgi:hypothetical protein
MKKQFILLMMIVLSAMLQFACLGSVTGPDDPNPTDPPFEEKRFTVKVKYIRVDVKRPDLMGYPLSVTITDRNTDKPLVSEMMAKKDDYHYEKEFSNILETESYGNCYFVHALDQARWDGVDNSSVIVGDRFILIVVETGSTLELTNILQNYLQNNPYKGPQAKMAKFCLHRDGTLTNG